MLNKMVMFDMDGTLTEPRQTFDKKILGESLRELSNYADIGIITGSDYDYLCEQMGGFLNQSACRYKTVLMPCNGTKVYWPPKLASEGFELMHEASMKDHLGYEKYDILMKELITSQLDMSHENVPLTGHFINCRGSLINWSPIGRNANHQEREEFIRIDKERGIRARVIGEFKQMLENKGVLKSLTVKLGGETSFDIYPKGWDKTYGLRHFQNWEVWFVGDRCYKDGNDYEIYEACQPRSYKTTGPLNTKEIIADIISKIKEEGV